MTSFQLRPPAIESLAGPLLGGALLLSIASCSSTGTGETTLPPPPPPAPTNTMTAVAGQNQVTDWGHPVPIPPAVLVVDASGQPIAGVTVTFSTDGANGSVTDGTVVTGSDGHAAVGDWWMNVPVGTKALTATAAGANSVQFTATAVARAQPQKLGGYDQSEQAGTAVLDLPAVQVSINNGNTSGPLVGAIVTFQVTAGGGTLTGATTVTDNYGVARLGGWTLGSVPGVNKVIATISWPAAPAVTFTATGTP